MTPPDRETPDLPADPFERRLAATPPREPPPEWRARILAAARSSRRAAFRLPPFPFPFPFRISLWPHPLAWGALAVGWLAIAALNISGPRGEALYAVTPKDFQGRLPSAEEYPVQLEWQRRLYLALAADSPAPRLRPFPRPQDL